MAANPSPNPNRSLCLLRASSAPLPPSSVECLRIDLASEEKSTITFTNPSVTENIFLEGHACVSHRALLLIAGGCSPQGEASKSIHIFNTQNRQWTRSNMFSGRARFAWGIIGNRLYIAGGFGGNRAGDLAEAEVYDFETEESWSVACMPAAIVIDAFFLHSGRLRVRGRTKEQSGNGKLKYFAYNPDRNSWQEDGWLLNVLKRVPFEDLKKFAYTTDGELYMVNKKPRLRLASVESPKPPLIISQLEKGTKKWEKVFGILDKLFSVVETVVPVNYCECPSERELQFFANGDGVVILMHHDHEGEGEVTPLSYGITEVSFPCPSKWSAAILDG